MGEKILRLRYFSYEVDEALHISDSERKTVEGIMDGIESEYLQGVDRHTQDIIVAQLDVLFCYAERFYDRQFRMRSNAEPDILVRVQRMFRQHLDACRTPRWPCRRGEFLSVSAVASELNMSPHYLNDLLRSQTGMNTKQHIHAYLVDCAKVLLANTQLSVSEVAYRLGFEYPQHFNRLFKRKTGITPSEYRKLT